MRMKNGMLNKIENGLLRKGHSTDLMQLTRLDLAKISSSGSGHGYLMEMAV